MELHQKLFDREIQFLREHGWLDAFEQANQHASAYHMRQYLHKARREFTEEEFSEATYKRLLELSDHLPAYPPKTTTQTLT